MGFVIVGAVLMTGIDEFNKGDSDAFILILLGVAAIIAFICSILRYIGIIYHADIEPKGGVSLGMAVLFIGFLINDIVLIFGGLGGAIIFSLYCGLTRGAGGRCSWSGSGDDSSSSGSSSGSNSHWTRPKTVAENQAKRDAEWALEQKYTKISEARFGTSDYRSIEGYYVEWVAIQHKHGYMSDDEYKKTMDRYYDDELL
jgi:hypothetical protein